MICEQEIVAILINLKKILKFKNISERLQISLTEALISFCWKHYPTAKSLEFLLEFFPLNKNVPTNSTILKTISLEMTTRYPNHFVQPYRE